LDSNELREYVRELNKRELVEHQRRREQALNKIYELRKRFKDKENNQVLQDTTSE
jgi:hypothetical protein